MNVECDQPTIDEITSMFKFSDAVLRNLVIRRDSAVTEASPLAEDNSGDDDSAGELASPAAAAPAAPAPEVNAAEAGPKEGPDDTSAAASGEAVVDAPDVVEVQADAEEKST